MARTQAESEQVEDGAPARPKRADALRNIEAIIEAATRLLAVNPDASLNEIAKEAGVGRITLYGHFDSRAALLRDVAGRAIAHAQQELATVDLDGDPNGALGRLLVTSWRLTHRFGALVVAASDALSPEQLRRLHDEPFARARRLLERGRELGEFRADVPIDWQLSVIQAILHGASAAVHRGEITADEAPELVCTTVIAALAR
ncbi:TetR/AcrR family transcriptional regulator [Occultella aeris]|uniref:Bacterial regulatory proteins, tetR family n=1 Tax=Occultella aeris TaxID=2761496 RepID=A0A7M4DIF3_9MICO|nr:TetR/AcrR family transcriptional regulator [Occultella aeris]VZO36726.1 Bacterial regulatory proteins, tetR family [Occultella aeris]